jgi:hypothetical protein
VLKNSSASVSSKISADCVLCETRTEAEETFEHQVSFKFAADCVLCETRPDVEERAENRDVKIGTVCLLQS